MRKTVKFMQHPKNIHKDPVGYNEVSIYVFFFFD